MKILVQTPQISGSATTATVPTAREIRRPSLNHPTFGSKSIPDPMNTPAPTRRIPPTSSSKGDTVVGFAMVGFLLAGAVGLVKAMGMTSGLDVLFCLLGSATAFGAVVYVCFHNKS
ncbi:MAG: hypothetical protein RIT19_1708 [Verrucomicrobiota bacterium]|jgi:hypothetical protein